MSTMRNMPIADLRTITTVEAAKAIEKIENIALLILPENGDPDILNAIYEIPMENVASTLTLPKEALVQKMIGNVTLSAGLLKSKNVLTIAGNAIVEEVIKECNATLIITGNLTYPKNCPINIHSATGNARAYDYEHYVSFDDDFELDAATLDLMDYKTMLSIDGDVRVAKDVTIELLKEKMPYFLVDGDVRCKKEVSAFFKLRAEIDGDLKVKGARYEEDEDDDE